MRIPEHRPTLIPIAQDGPLLSAPDGYYVYDWDGGVEFCVVGPMRFSPLELLAEYCRCSGWKGHTGGREYRIKSITAPGAEHEAAMLRMMLTIRFEVEAPRPKVETAWHESWFYRV